MLKIGEPVEVHEERVTVREGFVSCSSATNSQVIALVSSYSQPDETKVGVDEILDDRPLKRHCAQETRRGWDPADAVRSACGTPPLHDLLLGLSHGLPCYSRHGPAPPRGQLGLKM